MRDVPALQDVWRYLNPVMLYTRHMGFNGNFEKALADDGTMVLKFWMHISKEVQKERLESLESDPLRSWRMSDLDWKHYELYDKFIEARRSQNGGKKRLAFENFVRGISNQTRRLQKESGCAEIELRVVVCDQKVQVKARPGR